MRSICGRRASYEGRCVKVLWRKRGAKASCRCNLATVAKILDELCEVSANLGLVFGSLAGESTSERARFGHPSELKGSFKALQRLFELSGDGFRFGLPLALLLDHMLRRAADEFLVGELGVKLPDL
jgi:hypothetical protein